MTGEQLTVSSIEERERMFRDLTRIARRMDRLEAKNHRLVSDVIWAIMGIVLSPGEREGDTPRLIAAVKVLWPDREHWWEPRRGRRRSTTRPKENGKIINYRERRAEMLADREWVRRMGHLPAGWKPE